MPEQETEVEIGSVENPIDDIVERNAADASTLNGDAVPEAFRGKGLTDVFAEVQRLQNTLKINEELLRRMAAEPPKPQVVHVQSQPVMPVAPVQQGPTEDELTAMIADEDPKVRMQAWQYMQSRNNQMLADALERRLQPLSQGTIGAAEAQARQKYALEFELFDNEIKALRSRVPAEAFTNPQAWDELIRQARGTDPVKYVTELQKREGIRSIESVRAAAASDVGFVPPVRSSGPSGGPGGPSSLTDLQRKVAEEFGMTEREYLHFAAQGDVL